MVISVSRRTDIPAFYSEWFLNRIKEEYVDVINPFNTKQANRISLKKEDVDCFVFWTKNPKPLLSRINELDGYNYYFQYTVNSYGKDMEPNVPSKSKELIDTFIELSNRIGKEKVIWRYDPIVLTDKYDINWHIKYFGELAERLHQYTTKCVISFVDLYVKTKRNTKELNIAEITETDMDYIAMKFSEICKKYNLELATCCEKIDLEKYGIIHNSCIDGKLIEKLFNIKVDNQRDNQRMDCGCIKCHDIGAYNTCLHKCKYCYATFNNDLVDKNIKKHNPNSSLLIGVLDDKIKVYPTNEKCKEKEDVNLFNYNK